MTANPVIGPFTVVAEAAEEIMSENDNATIFQLFECVSCKNIQHNYEANTFNDVGTCDCGKETDLRREGCGFVAVLGDPKTVIEAAIEAACGGKPQGLPS
jgi:hypothetical protein